jgi:hypothetical protein
VRPTSISIRALARGFVGSIKKIPTRRLPARARLRPHDRFESPKIALMFFRTRAVNVMTAKHWRQRRNTMATFTIDSDNNITAHGELPAGADQSQSFTNQKELAKLTAEWPMSRLIAKCYA